MAMRLRRPHSPLFMEESFPFAGFTQVPLETTVGTVHWTDEALLSELVWMHSLFAPAGSTCSGREMVFRIADQTSMRSASGEREDGPMGMPAPGLFYPWALTNCHHGRSACLGRSFGQGGACWLFAKGLGWTNSPGPNGWHPALGNLGILSLKSAVHERNAAHQLMKQGLSVIRPLRIWETPVVFADIPGLGTATEVPDLDGAPARPSTFAYVCDCGYRICDLYHLEDYDKRAVLEEARLTFNATSMTDLVLAFAAKAGRGCGLLHSAGGHNFAMSPHNVFIDGTLVDFEYCYLPGIETVDANLNKNPEVWQAKELNGWHETLAALRYVCGVEKEISQGRLVRAFLDFYIESGGLRSLPFVGYLDWAVGR